MNDEIKVRDAYRAMFAFLEAYYDRSPSDELGALLSGLAPDQDGSPMDPAAWSDWLHSVNQVMQAGDP